MQYRLVNISRKRRYQSQKKNGKLRNNAIFGKLIEN